ncbi:NAD(P)-dependent malic enzyme [Candidatus Phytoplasma melaleucae]|uniref:NADP-dependent malic enzyme n=1 Tax=Candidatus Phytoplasma melaleucae TaxID=2982630 RepID=A0ABT9DDH4_9MOLU|nr:NADP-dependent malic enzyme ['Melaleuca sp.' phytoplasma]MDO8168089.1 NADP-dependent malic enzyme ['Melaleuca sp.' phytoplasma]
MDIYQESLLLHEQNKGKIIIKPKIKLNNFQDLSLAYTPGVAAPCQQIHKNPDDVYKYTIKSNTVAVITNGTAVLGLGDIGVKAALPVMEGKAVLFKQFADINAFPICIDSKNPQEFVDIVSKISSVFGAINLEDIKAPECFEIEQQLKTKLDIPVFHDDQHGTAIVVAAGLINALKVVNKQMENIEVLVIGSGAAGTAIVKMLLLLKVKNIVVYDKKGVIHKEQNWLNLEQKEISLNTNLSNETGTLSDIIQKKDVVIGVAAANLLTSHMISTMNPDAIVFALANPVPEIMPEEAYKGGAKIIATGRSDFPNQINNVLAFPGLFRGILNSCATTVNLTMQLAAVYALANIIPPHELNTNNIIPAIFNQKVVSCVAQAVAAAALQTGVVRKSI